MEISVEAVEVLAQQIVTENESPREIATVLSQSPRAKAMLNSLLQKARDATAEGKYSEDHCIMTSLMFAMCFGIQLGERLVKEVTNAN